MAKQFRLSNYTKILGLLVIFIILNSWYMLSHSENKDNSLDKINIVQTDRIEEVSSLRGSLQDTRIIISDVHNSSNALVATQPSTIVTTSKEINLGLGASVLPIHSLFVLHSLFAYLDTVLLIICARRPDYLQRTLANVLKYHPRNSVPIVISEDGNDGSVEQGTSKEARNNHNAYYKLSAHFKWALNQVFRQKITDNLVNRVIILEEDLEIAPDFFEYFAATSPLLDSDPTLLTVSAWNDNGFASLVQDEQQLYRSDFFPGLGWMMTRKLWDELEPKWPEAYWDDWLREPKNRKGRHIIRPEICRTYHFGKIGASNSEFGNFLDKIKLNDESKWNQAYIDESVKYAEVVTKESFQHLHFKQGSNVRINYDGFEGGSSSFVNIAHWAGVMDNIKANVPRTAYKGVVSLWKNGVKMHITPSSLI